MLGNECTHTHFTSSTTRWADTNKCRMYYIYCDRTRAPQSIRFRAVCCVSRASTSFLVPFVDCAEQSVRVSLVSFSFDHYFYYDDLYSIKYTYMSMTMCFSRYCLFSLVYCIVCALCAYAISFVIALFSSSSSTPYKNDRCIGLTLQFHSGILCSILWFLKNER